MWNREYQRRAARFALARAGIILARDANSGFYRPAKRPDPRAPKKQRDAPEQLNFNFADRSYDREEQPLADLIP
jgi:hypothetical protein